MEIRKMMFPRVIIGITRRKRIKDTDLREEFFKEIKRLKWRIGE